MNDVGGVDGALTRWFRGLRGFKYDGNGQLAMKALISGGRLDLFLGELRRLGLNFCQSALFFGG